MTATLASKPHGKLTNGIVVHPRSLYEMKICQQSQTIVYKPAPTQAVPKMVREQSDTKAKTANQEKEKHENNRKARTTAASLHQKPKTLPLP
ncbi:hypothetical protein MTR_8g058065 [Medicago truncatula]|uniref:Uncharacterized protein n=1 Tax=Medicago truncatula TaxID=3880 RepID=A0A072TPU0_MEDTR|nr:hypothetical protein MTR_8g058065 [Medicago truncatula]